MMMRQTPHHAGGRQSCNRTGFGTISMTMTPSFATRNGATTAFGLLALGYGLGSTSMGDLERLVHAIVLPLYTCVVLIYLTLRIYHVVIEPRLIAEPTKVSPPPPKIDESEAAQAEQPMDLSGAYKLLENINFEDFLAAQGVPWPLRAAANRARPTHHIHHKGNLLTIQIKGIIESQTTYQINGPPVQGLIRGRLFEDQVTYLPVPEGNGIQTMKRAVDDGYTIQCCRRLSEDGQQITMASKVTFDDPAKDEILCKQVFQRMEGLAMR
jgi:hypothetical protein